MGLEPRTNSLGMGRPAVAVCAEPGPVRVLASDSLQPSTIRMGVIGYGYWGPQIVRNFSGIDGCQVASVCDKSPEALRRIRQAYPGLEVTPDTDAILSSTSIDAVAVVTPVWAHFELAKAALENGKHV
ncbi:MAG: Gfo/Idh/MocA family protein, partial [Terriglobia bacterium]